MNRALRIREALAGRKLLGRSRHALTFEEPNGRRRVVQTMEPLHYAEGGDLLEIDTAWVPDAGRLKMAAHAFSARVTADFRPGEIMELERSGQVIGYRPLPLAYVNIDSDLLNASTIQKLSDPKVAAGNVAGDRITWSGAYGPGTTLEWRATPEGVEKWLELDSASRLPPPTISGPRHLAIPFALRMPGLRPFEKGKPLDMTDLRRDAPVELLGPDGDRAFTFAQPVAFDAAGASVVGELRFRQIGASLVLAAIFPLSWLADPARVYPLRLDPTVTQAITTGPDDITVRPNSGMVTFAALFVGSEAGNNVDWQASMRWPGLAVPQGATVEQATETLDLADIAGKPLVATMEILCEASDNAAQISDRSDFFARTLTAPGTTWTPAAVNGAATSPDFKSAVQAVIDRPGWASGAALHTFHRDVVRGNLDINRVTIRGYENGAATAPQLSIVYNEGVTPGPTDEISVTLRPRASADDGYTFNDGASGGFNRTLSYILANDISSTSFDYLSFIRMTLDAGQVLPQGVSLKVATLIFTSSGGADSAHSSKVSFAQDDAPIAPVTRTELLGVQSAAGGRVTLTPSTFWNPEKEHPLDVTALVQAIVNRPGYNSGAIMALWEPFQAGWGGSNNNHQSWSFDGNPAKTVRLEVTFLDPDPPVVGGEVRLL